MTARPARTAAELITFLERAEPYSSLPLSYVLQRGLRASSKGWVAEDRNGDIVGATVTTRLCFDRWQAAVYLADGAAGPALASAIDHSSAWAVAGPAPSVVPLVPHLKRLRRTFAAPLAVAGHPVHVTGEADPRTRVATRSDLQPLVELYAGYEIGSEATVWQVRTIVKRWLANDFVVVLEEGGELAGALVVGGRTNTYIRADSMAVNPRFRGRGMSWALLSRGQAIANEAGLGGIVVLAPTNPMTVPDQYLDDQLWVTAALLAPHRFTGEGRLRQLYSAVGRRAPRSATLYRNPSDPTQPPPA